MAEQNQDKEGVVTLWTAVKDKLANLQPSTDKDLVRVSKLEEVKEVNKEDKVIIVQSNEAKAVTFGTLTIDDIDLTNILSD